MAKQKILVTGSCGFIFSNFIRLAFKDNLPYEIVSIDKITRPEGLNTVYQNRSHNFYLGDVADHHFVHRVFELERPDIVVHGSAESHVDESICAAQTFVRSNVLGTQVLIDASLKYDIKKFVMISTDEVYGSLFNEDSKPWIEDSHLSPRNPYSASKLSAELLVKAAHETHDLPYIITRSCNNVGPWQSLRNLVPKVIGCILNNKKIPIYGQGLQMREWIHVVDNCYAIFKIIEQPTVNEIYNISTGYEVTNLEMVNNICNIMGSGHELISFVNDRPGHDFRYACDSSKLRELGWKPTFKFKDALKHTCKWYSKNQWFVNMFVNN